MQVTHFLDPFLFCWVSFSIMLIYLPFSPMTIDLVNFKRDTQLWIYRHRRAFWAAGIVSFVIVAGRAAGGMTEMSWLWGVVVAAGLFTFMFWSGYVPYVMTPPENQQVLDVAQADELLSPDDAVLGLNYQGVARAYPRDFIARPHFFTDVINGRPLTISYCILCNSGIAFESELDGREMHLSCVTAFNNNIIYLDAERGNFIQQLDGRVIYGPDKGRQLSSLPLVMATWKEWKEVFPDTKLYYAPAKTLRDKMVTMMLQILIPVPKLAMRTKPWHRIQGKLDGRIAAMSFVFGVEVGDDRCAYPISELRELKVCNDTVGGRPIAIFYDSKHELGAVFSREIDGKVLTFRAENEAGNKIVASDEETGSTWDVTGRARTGELDGQNLEAVPHYNKIFWFSWVILPH